MKITEKDIYCYVMKKDDLSLDKFKYIEQNIDQFIEEITFLKEFKENLKTKVSPGISDKIYNKIEEIQKTRIILKPINDDSEKLSINADQPFEGIKTLKTLTLSDDKREYLIKINSTEGQSKIYLFLPKSVKRNIAAISLNPSGDKYYINIDDQPLIIDSIDKLDSIELSFS